MKYHLNKMAAFGLFILFQLTGNAGDVSVVLRFDDYAADVPTEFERKLVQLCDQHRIALTLGVVPFVASSEAENPSGQGVIPLGQEKIELLRELVRRKKAEIAQHGYSHRTRSAQYLSEFHGMPTAEQMEVISKGKKYLEDAFQVSVTTFIPPWNRYDEPHVAVLEKVGFQTLSGGTRSLVTPSAALRILPATCELGQVRDAVQYASRQSGEEKIIVAGFHAYDFVEVDRRRGKLTLPELEQLLAWMAAQPQLKTRTMSEISAPYLTMANFARHKWNWFLCRRMPPFLVGPENYLYGEMPRLGILFYWNLLKAAAWYLFVAAIVAAAGWVGGVVCLRRIPLKNLLTKRRLLFLCGFSVLLAGAYGCRHLSGSYRELTITAAGVGILLAAWMLPVSLFQRSRVEQPVSTQ